MPNFFTHIAQSKPVVFIKNKSKVTVLPGFQGVPLWDAMKAFKYQLDIQGLNVRAAAISFNIVMAIPAATIFICTLIPYIPASKTVYKQLIEVINDVTPNEDTRRIMLNFLNDFFSKPTTGLISIGFLLALFYSSNAILGLIRTFDRSVLDRKNTNFIQKRFRAILLTTIGMLLLIGSLLLIAGQGVLFSKIMNWLHITNKQVIAWIQRSKWLITFLLFVYSIGFIYAYAPSYKKRRNLLTPGAILASILMIITTSVFSYWAQSLSTNYNSFYGPIGSLLILLSLVFINCLMLMVGFELNMGIEHAKQQKQSTIAVVEKQSSSKQRKLLSRKPKNN